MEGIAPQLSVVVQGAAPDVAQLNSLFAAVRKRLPQSPIILSTWEGSDTDKCEADVLVKSPLPPALPLDEAFSPKLNNLSRQLVSTKAGIDRVETPYVLKLRTDSQIVGSQFLAKLGCPVSSDLLELGIRERILMGRYCSASYLLSRFLFHFSDIWMAGLTVDLKKIWSIEVPAEPEFTNYLKLHPEKSRNTVPFPNRWIRCAPEQYIWSGLLRNQGVHLEGMLDTRLSWVISHLLLLNNYLTILDENEAGIRLPRHLEDRETFVLNLSGGTQTAPLGRVAAVGLAILAYASVLTRRQKPRHYCKTLLQRWNVKI